MQQGILRGYAARLEHLIKNNILLEVKTKGHTKLNHRYKNIINAAILSRNHKINTILNGKQSPKMHCMYKHINFFEFMQVISVRDITNKYIYILPRLEV